MTRQFCWKFNCNLACKAVLEKVVKSVPNWNVPIRFILDIFFQISLQLRQIKK